MLAVTLDIKDLKAQIDADYDARIAKHKEAIAKLEEDRELDHLAADRLSVRLVSLVQTGFDFRAPTPAPANPESNGHKPEGGSKSEAGELFPLRKEMRLWLVTRIGGTVTQKNVYDYLMGRFPQLEKRPERSLRAQISGVLALLAEQGFLKLKKKGLAGEPNLYEVVGDKKVEASQ